MRRIVARLVIILIILANAMPLIVFAADGKTPPLNKPYEKVVAKSGDWYTEQLTYDGRSNLVIGYLGMHENEDTIRDMEFEIKEKIVIKGIYLPFVRTASEPVKIQLKDGKGNVYKDLSTEKVVTNIVKDTSSSSMDTGEKISYIFTPENDIVLSSGQYTMTLSNFDGAVGAFLVKGVNYSAFEKYKRDLQKWKVENNLEKSQADKKLKNLGNEVFSEQSLDKYKYDGNENLSIKKPAVFLLDADYLIDEIMINTYNGGNGALPGKISILRENGDIVLTQQAYGGSLGDIANGIWKTAPNIVLPAGNYSIAMSDPNVISYDKFGEPLFYVKASPPVKIRYDFTGTYNINLDAYKTRTLLGSVSGKNSSFSLKDFELTVLDKGGEIELIGKYEGMPFSQACEIIKETENSIVAKFNFAADLSKLPYKARIGANAVVTLTKPENGKAKINIDGTGTYKREATAKKGADDNAYSIISNGVMIQKELPPFVMTALGKSGGAGNIPGADNPMQSAVGILFPPLVGVVVSTLQELLKPKSNVEGATRDKNWYKKKYPNLSDEQIAMVMLGDAMGNTDNPDDDDAVSVGDNEKPGGSDYVPSGEHEQEMTYEEEPELVNESEPFEEPDYTAEHKPQKAEEQPLPEEKSAQEILEEPEEMILQTSANGATSRYVKDPATGEWIDAETGSVLNYEKYRENAAKQFAEDKKFNDAEFDKNSRSDTEHDRILREEMKKISDKEKWEDYKNSLKSKYGTDNLDKIEEINVKRQKMNEASFEKWQTIGNVNAVGEVGATVVGAVADTAIDGLSEVTPGGAYIKAGYKVTKGVAGAMADKGVNLGSFVEGAVTGGADAATDFINVNNPYAKAAAKATVTVAGETAGSAAGAYIRGGTEDWKQEAADGLMDGIFKAGVGAVTDGITSNAPDITIPKGSLKYIPTMKNVLVNKTAATKIGSSLTDEFVVKPIVAQPIKDTIKSAFEANKTKK